MLSFPPHCSHKLQPLDVSVFGPFKRYCAAAQDAWLRNNPGKVLTIYDIPQIVTEALPLAMTTTNIRKGFEKTGICPFNANIFTDEDYSPSLVTDRPAPAADLATNTAQPAQEQPQSTLGETELEPSVSKSGRSEQKKGRRFREPSCPVLQ